MGAGRDLLDNGLGPVVQLDTFGCRQFVVLHALGLEFLPPRAARRRKPRSCREPAVGQSEMRLEHNRRIAGHRIGAPPGFEQLAHARMIERRI